MLLQAGIANLAVGRPFTAPPDLPPDRAASARIGDGRSSWESGVLSRVNAVAAAAGMVPGMSVQDAIANLAEARR